jgi:transcriptional regulator with XRE-family HTH domain
MRALKDARVLALMTTAELADLAQVSVRYVYALESGERTNPSLAVLVRLAAALDVPVYTIAVT